MRTPAKKHTHILRTLFGFALSLLMLVPFAMIVLNSFKNKKKRHRWDWHCQNSGTLLKIIVQLWRPVWCMHSETVAS